MTPTSVFALGRMRHLDLLTLWYRAHPFSGDAMGRASKERLIAEILATPQRRYKP